MFAHERHQTITRLLGLRRRLTVRELRRSLKVSPATLRRDLTEMEQAGAILRVHGGLVHPSSLREEPNFDRKSREAVAAKRAIAVKAGDLLKGPATVFVDSGTTCLEIGRLLLLRPEIRIATNSVPLLHEASRRGKSIIALGGELRPISGALIGDEALSRLQHLHADWAFLGASGLSANHGISTTELGEAAIKQHFLRNSRQHVLAADASKWEHPVTIRFADWADFDCWLTSGKLAPRETARLEKKLRIIRCAA